MKNPDHVLLVGYGSIGQGLTPLLFRHSALKPEQVSIIAADEDGMEVAEAYGLHVECIPLTPNNYSMVLAEFLGPGNWLINISVDVSSAALIDWCQEHQVLYLDTCVEPWAGGYRLDDIASTTNYVLRHELLRRHRHGQPTAVIAHGANPGLISHFVKAGLVELARMKGVAAWTSWANLACLLGIRVVQIAERDSQSTDQTLRPGEFVNTWSVDGLVAESWQRAELGWGTHEKSMPIGASGHASGEKSAIFLADHGIAVKVKSWVPSVGEQSAYLISHHEAISIANLLTIPGKSPDTTDYRPTVYFAYHPAEITCQSIDQWVLSGYSDPGVSRLLREDILDGSDQLGVLFVFDEGAYWYGSTLDIHEARRLAPFNNATSMQVVAGILGALDWMQKNPDQGIVEAESMDYEHILNVARPYLGEVSGYRTDWHPGGHGTLQFSDFVLAEHENLLAA